jgi:hypothetical protein
VGWQNIATPAGTWFAIFPVSATDANYLAWWNTTSVATDSASVTLPALATGPYELRLFTAGGTRLALSNTFFAP